MTSVNHPARSRWAKLGSAFSTLAVAGFIAACLWARWTPVYAQDVPPPQKKDNQKKNVQKKDRPANPAPQAQRPAPVVGSQVDAITLAKTIDQHIQKQLDGEKIAVSPKSDDAEFLRRIYLDLVGVIPPADKVKSFLASNDPAKRAKVIDELLADPRFGSYVGEQWAKLLLPRESNNKKQDIVPLQHWLAERFNKNVKLDQIVYDLLTATGTIAENGAASYFVANPTVDKITDNVTRMFVGVQLQCAQCHNHPFTNYKQTEYWGMAAFFMKVKLTNANPKNVAKKGDAAGISETATAIKGKKLPDSAKLVPATFLHGEQPKIADADPARPVLAKWLTTPGNRYFARAMVNRFWHHLFARGIVNPVDDMHDDNDATHPELLAALTHEFQASGCDVKYLVRAICNSETYQRTSRPIPANADDVTNYSHRLVRVMTPEQMYDSLTQAIGNVKVNQPAADKGAKKGPPTTGRDGFVAFFRIDDGADALEYQIGVPQALRLMNSPQFNNLTGAVADATANTTAPAEVIENLFLRTLSRRPTPQEVTRFTAHVNQAANPRTGYGDVLWALLNSSEFTTNH